MNISKGVKHILFLLITINSIAYIHADTKPSQEELLLLDKSIQQEFESMAQGLLKGLDAIQTILQDIALDIKNDQIKITNKKDVNREITSLTKIITGTKIDVASWPSVDPLSLQLLMQFNSALMDHVSLALKKNFKSIPTFDFAQIQKRGGTGETITLEELDEKLSQLQSQADHAGISWYNHGYRTFNNYFLYPTHKYNLGPKVAFASLTGAAALYLWYRSNSDNPALRNWLGDKPVFDRMSEEVTNQKQLKLLGKTEKLMIENSRGMMPVGAMLFGSLLPTCKNGSLAVASWCKKHLVNMHQQLLGGTYNKKSDDEKELEIDIDFKDIIGMEYEKELFRDVINYVVNPEAFDRKKLSPEKGYLFTGPSRTGKTHLAQAISGEIQSELEKHGRSDEFRCFNIHANRISVLGIETFLAEAKEKAPCVIIVDELDTLGLQRAGGDSQLLCNFLTALHEFLSNDANNRIIFIGITNRPENLDFAIKQPGRLGTEVRFDYPCLKNRKQFLLKQLDIPGIQIDTLNLDQLALETEGCSFETIAKIVRSSLRKCRHANTPLSQKILEASLAETVFGIISQDKNIPEQEQKIIAAHQAGLALSMLLLNTQQKVAWITNQPVLKKIKEESVWQQYSQKENDPNKQKNIEYGAVFTHYKQDALKLTGKDEKKSLCKVQLAGHIAEELILGSCGYSYHKENKQHALEIAKSIVCEGIDITEVPKHIKNKYYDEAFALLKECGEETKTLLNEHKDTLELIANTLQERKTLSASDITTLMEHGTLDAIEQKKEPTSAVDPEQLAALMEQLSQELDAEQKAQ